MASFFLGVFFFGVVLATPVHAVSSGSVVLTPALTAIETQETLTEKVKAALAEVFKNTAALLWKNTADYFLQTIAQDTARWIASGGKGQEPLFISEGWGSYLQKTGEEAAATGVLALAKDVGLGNICVPPGLALNILLPQIEEPRVQKPACSLEDLSKTWDVTSPDFLENFSLSFRTQQNDLSVAVNFLGGLRVLKDKKLEEATKKREESLFKAIQTAVSKVTKTPAVTVEKQYENSTKDLGATVGYYTGRPIADAVGVFAQTLLAQYLKQLQGGVFNLASLVTDDNSAFALNSLLNPDAISGSNLSYTATFKADIRKDSNFDLVTEFSQCPAETQYASVFNCVIDQSFALAIRGDASTGFNTIETAIQKDLLNGDWPFGYTNPVSGTEPSYLNGYAYSNMTKLRKARIIPVGWEIAAQRSRQLGESITLQEVIDSFDDEGSPYFKLVDPDWVLKVPSLTCKAKVPGQTLVPGSTERTEYCADIQDCVATGSNGECLNFAYCTNEKKTWELPAEKCSQEFATCESYTQIAEARAAGDPNLWLGNTLDYTGCTAESAGCLWYALNRNSVGEFTDANRVYLTGATEECSAEDGGCNEYILTGNESNLLRNPSFEDDGGHNYVLGNGDSTQGNGIPDGWSARQSIVELDADAQHGAVAVKLTSLSGNECLPGLQYVSPIGSYEVDQTYTISGQVKTNTTAPREITLGFENLRFTIEEAEDEWTSFAFNFQMPATNDNYTLVLGANDGSCGDLDNGVEVLYDSIKIERGLEASDFSDYRERNVVTLANAPSCTFEEVGCQQYNPVDPDLGVSVTGIVTGVDLCPAECVGYTTYEQKATDLEATKFANFIPATARSCQAAAVGCQEFTNLDIVNQGGEGTEYYTEIRHCEKPSDDSSQAGSRCAPFFAWEGSDITGYQLVSFNLVANGSGGVGAPETTDGTTSCDPETNTDCRELIAADGQRYFRDLTKTITCSNDCVPLRAGPNVVTQTECEERFGSWDSTISRCIYQAIPEESLTCTQAAVGCREFVGATGTNIAVIFADDFEEADFAWENGSRSTESTQVGGHSLRLDGAATSINQLTSIEIDEEDYEAGKSYLLSFQAKSNISDVMTVNAWLGADRSDSAFLGAVNTSTRNWNQYQVGPVFIPEDTTGDITLFMQVIGTSDKPEAIQFFVDSVLVRQIKSSLFLVKDSWETPNTCDTDPPLDGGTAGRSMLGCQAYRASASTGGEQLNIKSFTRLCSEEKVGCSAVINTQNSTAPYREIFNEGDEAETIVPEDRVQYIVVDEQYVCNSEVKGCTELGQPIFDQDKQILNYEPVYKINDPDRYEEILCKGESLFCQQYANSRGESVFAKDPGLAECEYRPIPNTLPKVFAWYKVGGDEPNPEECVNARQSDYAQRCSQQEVSCTQYFEPITQNSYFYKKNTLLDLSSECNGAVDWKKGCVLFNDVSLRSASFKSGDPDNGRDVDGARLAEEEETHINYKGGPLGCQTGDAGCDTNILLRVNLDRQCTQWLTGVSTGRFYDELSQQYKTNSYSLGRCIEADPANPTVCRTWDNSIEKEPLTLETYVNRDTSWSGEEYTGYSIPNLYPVETLRQYNLTQKEDGEPENFRLAHLREVPGSPSCVVNSDCSQLGEVPQICKTELDPATGRFAGTCFQNFGLGLAEDVAQPLCRAYPEADSPFPSGLAQFEPETSSNNGGEVVQVDPIFEKAKIGQPGEIVECSYQKVDYTVRDRYYSVFSDPPQEITVDESTNKLKKKSIHLGWRGYCLEKDSTRFINGSTSENACLTWHPIDVIEGEQDLNNSTITAGYLASDDAQYYCARAVPAQYITAGEFCGVCPSAFYDTIVQRSGTCGSPSLSFNVQSAVTKQLGGWTSEQWFENTGSGAGLIASLVGGIGVGLTEAFGSDVFPEVTCVPKNGDGWYPMLYPIYNTNNNNHGIMCTHVARVQDSRGTNAVWTDRIQNEDYLTTPLGWPIDQLNEPFGAARPDTFVLEELADPLIIKTTSEWAYTCDNCEIPDGQQTGICKDDEPGRNGKRCPFAPNAGAPYAFSAVYPQWVNNAIIPIRAGNLPVAEAEQPYNANETYQTGVNRLQQLFARSYGVWQWQLTETAICVGSCQGGLHNGEFCASNAECGEVDADITYSCVAPSAGSGLCVGGLVHSQSCSTDSDCNPVESPHKCVEADESADSVFICSSGPFKDEACLQDVDCGADIGAGVCDFSPELSRCQGTENGSFIYAENSGELCTSSAECNAPAICAVDRCSSEVGGINSGLCSGLQAGASCGADTATKGYREVIELGWDIIEDNTTLAELPIIAPVVPDPDSPNGLGQGFALNGGFSVNGNASGDVTGVDGRAPVEVAFYAYNENGEQMPIRTTLVDWGDGTDATSSYGAFKNRKHVCRRFCGITLSQQDCTTDSQCTTAFGVNSSCDDTANKCILPGAACTEDANCQTSDNPEATCDPLNFGDSEQACIQDSANVNGFFTFSHTYTWDEACPVKGPGNSCIYVPQVLVKDNWGASRRVTFPGQVIVQPPLPPAPVDVALE